MTALPDGAWFGAVVGDAETMEYRLVELFTPPWWRADRHVAWWLTPRAERAAIFLEGRRVRVRLRPRRLSR